MLVTVIFVLACFGIITADELDLSFQSRLQKLRTNIGKLAQENKELKSKLKSMEEKYGTHLKDKETSVKRQESNLTGIGFTAGVSQTLTNIGTQQRIVFDRFVSGNPESYDTATGIFTVPVSGWYVFQVSMLVDTGFEADLHIIRAHNPTLIEDISGLYADARFSASDASSSRTIVLYLVKGGEIFVRNGFKTTIELHGNQFTTFSGWLLYELAS